MARGCFAKSWLACIDCGHSSCILSKTNYRQCLLKKSPAYSENKHSVQFIHITQAKVAPKRQTLEETLKGEKFPRDSDKAKKITERACYFITCYFCQKLNKKTLRNSLDAGNTGNRYSIFKRIHWFDFNNFNVFEVCTVQLYYIGSIVSELK